MDILSMPTGYGAGAPEPHDTFSSHFDLFSQSPEMYSFAYTAQKQKQSHPSFWHLVLLVTEAVLEVVCVSGLGYIAARRGLFTAATQKNIANLNIMFFTPCLILSKLSSQLNSDKLSELWIIPVILFLMTVISWVAALGLTRLFKLKKAPQRNFVTAMAVFGNSNSLPLSLVISLSHTISGLHWDKVPKDNDDEVGARGILYLLIFSQLGQAVRWSWGMNTLLRPMEAYTPEERGELPRDEEVTDPYKDDVDSDSRSTSSQGSSTGSYVSDRSKSPPALRRQVKTDEFAATPDRAEDPQNSATATKQNGSLQVPSDPAAIARPKSPIRETAEAAYDDFQQRREEFRGWRAKIWSRISTAASNLLQAVLNAFKRAGSAVFSILPQGLQKVLSQIWHAFATLVLGIYSCLNIPLMAIIVAVLIGSVPQLKAFFHTRGTFVNNTITSAVNQCSGVAVPLILFVLGGNLCKSTVPAEDVDDKQYMREKKTMLWLSILCRMLIPLIFMAPILAILAKYTPISILDDPIFIIVCFLLVGAPSALQLAQICQVNDVFVPVISQLLFQSYVVWIFPSTLILVMLALEVVKWANMG